MPAKKPAKFLTTKQLEAYIAKAFPAAASGYQFNVLDLGKIKKACLDAYAFVTRPRPTAEGGTVEILPEFALGEVDRALAAAVVKFGIPTR